MIFVNKLKKLDWTILFLLFLFMIVSYFIISSATLNSSQSVQGNAKKQVIFFIAGFLMMLCVALFDYRHMIKLAWVGYAFGIILLIGLYLLPESISPILGGAHGWYDLGPMLFQPAELMKFLLIIAISAYLVRCNGEKLGFFHDVIPIGIIGGIPFVIIALLPDLGNAVILLVVMLGLYWIGNIKFTHVLLGAAAITIVVGGFLLLFVQFHEPVSKAMTNVGGEHWVGRIDTFLKLEGQEDAQGDDYQAEQSKQAIATGSLFGEGYKNGPYVQGGNVPVIYSDAIFVVVAEEFGFIGSSVLLMLYFFLIYRMIVIAMECTDRGGGFLIIGIVSLYVFQIFQNIGMFIELMPITGITLPFVSYGGTSLLINLLAMGIVLSVKIHGNKPVEGQL
ncbi:MAG: FtsW/RodA/SpoVE family cell cycle protein [Gorillibacterium sp.]|nr:FtsW/RodA/SpoVE family cell cycle protein [Gorillibacterium sp.]